MKPPWPLGSPVVQIAAMGLLSAFIARNVVGYPNCSSDEGNWGHILSQIEQGVGWPVSGPLFVWIVQGLTEKTGWSYPATLSTLGLFMVPVLLGIAYWTYARLAKGVVMPVFVVLATTTYFWAPLLESRPQQWGQFMVLAGNAMFWIALKGKMPWIFFTAILILLSMTHILSFAILAGSVLISGLLAFLLNKVNASELAKIAAHVVLGSVIFLVPDGPYDSMLRDIRDNHLLVRQGEWLATGTVLLLLIGWISRQRLAAGIRTLIGAVLHRMDNSPGFAIQLGGVATALALLSQAALLPSEAWRPYHGSWMLFGVAQAGNIFFFWLVLQGWILTRRKYVAGEDCNSIEEVSIMSSAFGLLALIALAGSVVMLHTNWMLRLLNYGVLIVAPLAALGLRQWIGKPEKSSFRLIAVFIFGVVSYISAIRPAALFKC